jgi:hypothetical protein
MICIDCGNEALERLADDTTAKTFRCCACGTTFIVERHGDDWRLTTDGKLLTSGAKMVQGYLGMLHPSELPALFDPEARKRAPNEASREPSEAELDERPWGGYEEPEPDLEFLKSLGRNIPRRYAHLVSAEDLTRESTVFWPGSVGRHVLADSIPDGREFIPHVEEHIEGLARLLHVERETLDYSVASSDFIDDVLIRENRASLLKDEWFRGLVAYAGEIIRRNVDGEWIAEYDATSGWWEPVIRDAAGKLCDPFLTLYKGILEDEAGAFGVSVAIEIQSSSVWQRNGEW